MRRVLSAIFMALLVIAQPALTRAAVYSPVTYSFDFTPDHQAYSKLCFQAGLTSPVSDYGIVLLQDVGSPLNFHCNDIGVGADDERIGIRVRGYRSGYLCATSSWADEPVLQR